LRREKEVKKGMKKTKVTVLALALLMMLTAIAPTFAKNFNLPEGVSRSYWAGGICVVALTTTWPPLPAAPATQLRIDVRHHEAGTYGAGDSLNIDARTPSGGWLPVTYFTTNTDPAFLTFIRKVYYRLPIGMGTLNAKYVPASDLTVERQGNRITAELKTKQTVLWAKLSTTPAFVQVDIPPFKLELDQVGGSLHLDFEEDLSSYSGYVFYEDMMGFDGNGVLTCSAWNFVNHPVTLSPRPYCGITMHGITTYFPPPPA